MNISINLPELPPTYVWEFGWDNQRNLRIALRRPGHRGLTRQVRTVECFTEPENLPGRVDAVLHEMILKEEQRLQREEERK